MLMRRPFARLRRAQVVPDAFTSPYDTVVKDRRLARRNGITTRFLKPSESLARRAADLMVLDTAAHAELFARLCCLRPGRLGVVMIGAEPEQFPRLPARERMPGDPVRVLFHGQFVPSHGVRTIIDAARPATDRDEKIEWILGGIGQEAVFIRDAIPRERFAPARQPLRRAPVTGPGTDRCHDTHSAARFAALAASIPLTRSSVSR